MAVSRLPKAVITITGTSGRLAASRRAELDAVHAGHLQVGQHDVEVLAAEGLEGLLGRGEAAGREIAQPQVGLQQVAHAPLVIDDEDSWLHGLAPSGKKTVKQLPSSGPAGHVDPAAVLLDDAVGDRQPQSGAFADLLGGEERLEEVLHVLLGDAHALGRGSRWRSSVVGRSSRPSGGGRPG